MLKTLFLDLLLLLCAQRLCAGTAILWIPAEHSRIDDVIYALEAQRDLKLTAALEEIPAPLADRIKELAAAGRLEPAARPARDPLLPLFYYPGKDNVRWQNKPSSAAFAGDPFFTALRMSDARDANLKTLTTPPEGFVNAPGGVIEEYFPLAKALGFKWVAAGPLISTAAFSSIEAGGVNVIPFSAHTSPATGAPAADFLVFDETMPGAGTDTRAALLNALSDQARRPLFTVSEALKISVSTSLAPSDAAAMTAPWSGDYTFWAGEKIQAGALTAFTRTRAALMAHLNAKQGDYKAARKAFLEYFAVESGAALISLANPDQEAAKETEIEIQSALANAYRLMNKDLPGWLFSTLADVKDEEEAADKVTVKKSSTGFTLLNSARRSSPPADARPQDKEQDPYKLWKLARIDISWTAGEALFSFTPLETSGISAGSAAAAARFDLYMDVNNRPRAGSSRFLDGRPGRIFPDNSWEYMLEVSPVTAVLYVATAKGPQKAGTFAVGSGQGSFLVRVPRSVLKGNPYLWSYLGLMLHTPDGKTFEISDFLAEDFSNGYYYAVRPARK